MQSSQILKQSWRDISNMLFVNATLTSEHLVPSMLLVAEMCAISVRANLPEPLTDHEHYLLDEELEDEPNFDEAMSKFEAIASTQYVLKFYEKGVQVILDFRAKGGGIEDVVDVSLRCWDHVVPEYTRHQLAHLVSLLGAQLVSRRSDLHHHSWLFQMSDDERWVLFLDLAQDLSVLNRSQMRELEQKVSALIHPPAP